jgi:hypothetical protein
MRILLQFALAGLALTVGATTAPAAEPPAPDGPRILSSVEVDYGDHSVFYNRIETPVLKPQASRTPVPPREPTAEEIAEAARIDAKRQVNLWISCTVFDGQFTEVRFPQDGQEVVIHSTIDFNLLGQGFDLETENSLYNLYLGLGDVPRDEFMGEWPVRLLAEAARAGRSKWQVVSRLQPSADTVRTIEDLHGYFDAHRETLVALRSQREAAQKAREEWLKANPPVPEDIVVNYFPVRSSYPPPQTPPQRP